MFCYKRKTGFIDYYINGIKSRSIGIIKQKLDEDRLEIAVEITGPAEWKNYICKVSIGDGRGEEKLAEIPICNGQGHSAITIAQEDLKADNYKKIFFSFGNECYGVADLLDLPEAVGKEVIKTESISDLEAQPDKWEMIKKKYPILYPFKGQGPYVSIKPVDLQLLNPKYHSLNQNSYLMHSFYQYRHMILGEYMQEKGTFFYVGVPGEFVKKEQTSAAMFGFEGYEHSGDLGYYLYRVEL